MGWISKRPKSNNGGMVEYSNDYLVDKIRKIDERF